MVGARRLEVVALAGQVVLQAQVGDDLVRLGVGGVALGLVDPLSRDIADGVLSGGEVAECRDLGE